MTLTQNSKAYILSYHLISVLFILLTEVKDSFLLQGKVSPNMNLYPYISEHSIPSCPIKILNGPGEVAQACNPMWETEIRTLRSAQTKGSP
jgi:hypothetical protein